MSESEVQRGEQAPHDCRKGGGKSVVGNVVVSWVDCIRIDTYHLVTAKMARKTRGPFSFFSYTSSVVATFGSQSRMPKKILTANVQYSRLIDFPVGD